MQLADGGGLLVTLPGSLGSAAAARLVAHLDAYQRQVFVYGRSWDVVLRALDISQECVMAHLLATDFWIAKSVATGAGKQRREARNLKSLFVAHFPLDCA